MSRTQSMLLIATVLLLATGVAGTAAANTEVSVPIANADFEADQLPFPGADQPTIIGWNTTAGGGDGIFRPTTSDYPGGAPSGENVAYVNLPGNRVTQVLTTTLEANTKYVLKVDVGWRNNVPFAGYIVQLWADVHLLAEDHSSQTPRQGTFVTSTIEFTPGLGHPALGEPLEIRLLAPGIQANYDDVRLTATNVGVCAEVLLVPFYLIDRKDPFGTNTLFAVRNLTAGPVDADIELFTVGGTSQVKQSISLGADETTTVSIRDLPGLAVDADGFARGFVRVIAAGDPGRAPVLAGDFFQVDVGNDFATGERLVRQGALCSDASIRSQDFGVGTRFTIFLTQPQGDVPAQDPPSFTIQVHDEAGNAVGAPKEFWTADHANELASADIPVSGSATLSFDFSNSLGGSVYAEYSAEGRFSVGVTAQCDDSRSCEGTNCCPPGSRTATAAGLHFPALSDCETAISEALRSLDSFHFRNACQQAYGGTLPDAVLGARVVDCQVAPPGFDSGVVVAVEACCPTPSGS